MKRDVLLFPAPQQVVWHEETCALPAQDAVYTVDSALPNEGYTLCVEPNRIAVRHATPAGAFYAKMTLRQLEMQCAGAIPSCEITDAPGLAVRGFMLDISRGKVPTLATLLELVDLLALFKMNQLQLYIEGLSFAYPSFPALWEGKTPLTGEELQQLDAYCRARFIDLVPNQNCLGHMAGWLDTDQFRHLAEKEEGFQVLGVQFPPSTLNPLDPESVALIDAMSADLLPNFTSAYFNFNLDEPELGKGKSAAAVQAQGVGAVYLDYVKKMHTIAKKYGKQMLMWGDIVAKHFSIIDDLPADIILLEWGYEAEHPFAQRAKVLSQNGRPFCLCPGTSTWSSITGMTDNMLKNIAGAAENAYTYGALGMVLTDWGDGGHLQYLPVSYAPLAFSAALSWNRQPVSEATLTAALDRFVFLDTAGVMGRLCLDAGRYAQFEAFAAPCRTLISFLLLLGYQPREKYEALLGMILHVFSTMMVPQCAAVYAKNYENRGTHDFVGLAAYMQGLLRTLEKHNMHCAQAQQIQQEYTNAINMVLVLENILFLLQNQDTMHPHAVAEIAADSCRAIAEIEHTHRELWCARNKSGGLEASLHGFQKLSEALDELANDLCRDL